MSNFCFGNDKMNNPERPIDCRQLNLAFVKSLDKVGPHSHFLLDINKILSENNINEITQKKFIMVKNILQKHFFMIMKIIMFWLKYTGEIFLYKIIIMVIINNWYVYCRRPLRNFICSQLLVNSMLLDMLDSHKMLFLLKCSMIPIYVHFVLVKFECIRKKSPSLFLLIFQHLIFKKILF